MPIERLHEIWPEWTVQEQIGEGSFGKVYKAVHVEQGISAYAAIKVIPIPKTQSEIDSIRSEGLGMDGTRTYFRSIVNDFANEIKLMHSLKGIQNIVSVEDFRVVEKENEIGWDIFIRMELLTPFNSYISDKKLTEEDVIRLGIDICTALEICSKRNIIHRDIKPENIFVNDFGDFKLGDFGIARKLENMTDGLSQKGTVNYMAPEVANGRKYDSRVDIYSLGIVLYRLLNNNRLPFLDTQKQVINYNERKIATERRLRGEPLPPPCEASFQMAKLILKACAFDPNQRFASASAMKRALIKMRDEDEATVLITPDDNEIKEAVSDTSEILIRAAEVKRSEKESAVENEDVLPSKENYVRAKESSGFEETVAFWQTESKADESAETRKPEERKGTQVQAKPTVHDGWPNVNQENYKTVAVRRPQGQNVGSDKPLLAHQVRMAVIFVVLCVCIFVGMIVLAQMYEYTGIMVTSLPDKTSYFAGDTADLTGLVISAKTKMGNSKVLNGNYTVQGTSKLKVGENKIIVSYKDLSTSFTVNAEAIKIASISVNDMPKKTTYYVGETLDSSGLSLTVTYNNGTTKIASGGYRCSPMTFESEGIKKITVTYSGETTSFNVTCESVALTKIAVKSMPSKTSYYTGETLDISGLALTATYSDGTTKTIDSGFTYSPTKLPDEISLESFANPKSQENITVTYGGKTTSFTVTAKLSAYYIDGELCTLEYYSNDEIKKFTRHDSSGNVKFIKEYDANGNMVKVTGYNSDGTIRYVSEYDSNGNEKTYWYNSNGTVDYYALPEYDSNGHMVKAKGYNLDGTIRYINEYGSNGNKKKETGYNSDGTIKYVSEYDSNGNEEKTYWYNLNGTVDYYSVPEYDSNGNEVKATGYNLDGSVSYIIDYDSNGNRRKETGYNSDGTITYVIDFDSNGNKKRKTNYNSDGSFASVSEFDSNGNEIKEFRYDSDGNIEFYWISEYNSKGNIAKKTCYYSDGKMNNYVVYKHDSKGNIVKKTCYYPSGRISFYTENEYDSKGNRTKETKYNPDGSITAIYEYDSNGNRIQVR